MASESTILNLVKSGVRMRYPLRDPDGVLLLNQGATVTPRLQEILEKRGINLELEASLIVESGEPVGLEIPLRKMQVTVGRRPECDVRIDSAAASGQHCRIFRQRFSLLVRDLGSRNGTLLNGKLVEGDAELGHLDLLRIATTVFQVQIFAALRPETRSDEAIIQAWIRERSEAPRLPSSPYAPTLADIDLGVPS